MKISYAEAQNPENISSEANFACIISYNLPIFVLQSILRLRRRCHLNNQYGCLQVSKSAAILVSYLAHVDEIVSRDHEELGTFL